MNTTNTNKEEKAITFSDLWRVLLTALPLMLIVGIIFVGVGYAYRKVTYHPQYTSKGSFFILRDLEGIEQKLSSEASLAIGLTPSFLDIVTSDYVYENTAKKLNETGYQISSRQVRASVSVTIAEKSIVVPVRAAAPNAEDAENLLAVFMETAMNRVNELFRMEDEKTFVSYCDHPSKAYESSSFGMIRILLIALLGMIVVYGVYLVLDLVDDRIRTGEDVADVAGLTLLGIVPDADTSERKYTYKYGRKYAKHYGRYGGTGSQKKEG
ncbi:MAG: hypothetical protein J6Z04_01290 [Clostridia bacterium]|nr:hypothetical protein [Clostridia bacterium]